jgi:hypothetical protein
LVCCEADQINSETFFLGGGWVFSCLIACLLASSLSKFCNSKTCLSSQHLEF